MIVLTSLEVYNSILNISDENNKFENYTDHSDEEVSINELKDKIAEVPNLSDISPKDLEHEIYGPDIIKTCTKLSIEKRQTDGYCILLLGYAKSPFRDSESYLRNLTGLDEDDLQLSFKNITNQKLSYLKVLQALTHLKICLKFFQEVLKLYLRK